MRHLSTDQIREAYLDFFEKKGHHRYPSDTLAPKDDPTVLFTSAGMAQFKAYFLGKPTDHRRAASCQKCLRTDDLDKVGKTPSHHTFFEMLGNFSFGDYFKSDAIPYAWEFMTKVLEVPAERLFVSIYREDEEAYAIWRKNVGLADSKITRLGDQENFWPSEARLKGPNGPCGPCSEIFYDFGKEVGCRQPACGPACACGRFVEVWNLVFTQFNRQEGGGLVPLPQKNIDTGMGLERMASVLQGVKTNFEIDILAPLVEAAALELGVQGAQADSKEVRSVLNAVVDHLRAAAFAIADGVVPSNEGRGYVVRKLIRKATWVAKSRGNQDPYLYRLLPKLSDLMKRPYPEIGERQKVIVEMIRGEEERFSKTLETGQELLNASIAQARKAKRSALSGEVAFKLYDTFGFPLELTQEIAASAGLTVETSAFDQSMEAQRFRGREKTAFEKGVFVEETDFSAAGRTAFVGYEAFESDGKVLLLTKGAGAVSTLSAGDDGEVVLDSTPFYAESGGQVGDTGMITHPSGRTRVLDTIAQGGVIIHRVHVDEGVLSSGNKVHAAVDAARRLAIRRNHTATHLLHHVLRAVLGEQVHQAGSLVAPDRLRFDFSYPKGLDPATLERVEDIVNEKILRNDPVHAGEVSREEAKHEGALALFGEKYGDRVRLVNVGGYSKELCGGTHTRTSGEVGLFKILSESSVASGVRRIEAITGEALWERLKQDEVILGDASARLRVPREGLLESLDKLQAQVRESSRELDRLKVSGGAVQPDELLRKAEKIGGATLLAETLPGLSPAHLRQVLDQLRAREPQGFFVLASTQEGKLSYVAGTGSALMVDSAGLLKEAAQAVGGQAGGRRDMAQGGAKDAGLVDQFLQTIRALARKALKGNAP